jgi:glycosyltransferase involved in cell wall biosynthesis
MPIISVLVVARTRRRFLLEAVASAAHQTLSRREYEIVVVKDFSDPEIDRRLSDQDVRMVLDENYNAGSVFDAGIRACNGEIVCLLDDDDTFEPGKLDAVRREFSERPDLVYLHNGLTLMDEGGRPLGPKATGPGDRASALSGDLGFGTSCISIRRSAFLGILPKWRGVPRSPDSFLYFVSLASSYPMRGTMEPLTRYRSYPWSNSGKTNHALSYLATARVLCSLPPSRVRNAAISSLLGRYMSAAIRGKSADRRGAAWALVRIAAGLSKKEVDRDLREVVCGALLVLSPGAAWRLYRSVRKGEVDWLPAYGERTP